jgi:hypothetical protein
MINLLVTVFGGLLAVGGLYLMYLGFATPPSFLSFFAGLCCFVLGFIIVVMFASRVNLSKPKKQATPRKAPVKKPEKLFKDQDKKVVLEEITKNIKTESPKKPSPVKPKPAVKPRTADKPAAKAKPEVKPSAVDKPAVKPKPEVKPETADKKETPKPAVRKPIKPAKKAKPEERADPSNQPYMKRAAEASKTRGAIETTGDPAFKPVKPVKKDTEVPGPVIPVKKSSEAPKEGVGKIKPVPKMDKVKPTPKPQVKPKSIVKPQVKPVPAKNLKPQKSKLHRSKKEEEDDEFVKNRLNRLKQNYIQNAKDLESLIDERLDSFKGTLDQLKSESQEPSIIWSFDASDVQDALKDTISKSEKRILMMYPWVRNIDVSVLKKFMDTESRMIIQEASLDDETSVELIKLLMDNDVKIRTMPHVHTVAVVSDEANGLIISTDPIYESFEVGVVYKDQKSIEEIERLFEDAWSISKNINLEKKQ